MEYNRNMIIDNTIVLSHHTHKLDLSITALTKLTKWISFEISVSWWDISEPAMIGQKIFDLAVVALIDPTLFQTQCQMRAQNPQNIIFQTMKRDKSKFCFQNFLFCFGNRVKSFFFYSIHINNSNVYQKCRYKKCIITYYFFLLWTKKFFLDFFLIRFWNK